MHIFQDFSFCDNRKIIENALGRYSYITARDWVPWSFDLSLNQKILTESNQVNQFRKSFNIQWERYNVQGEGFYKVQGGVYKVQGPENFSDKGR